MHVLAQLKFYEQHLIEKQSMPSPDPSHPVTSTHLHIATGQCLNYMTNTSWTKSIQKSRCYICLDTIDAATPEIMQTKCMCLNRSIHINCFFNMQHVAEEQTGDTNVHTGNVPLPEFMYNCGVCNTPFLGVHVNNDLLQGRSKHRQYAIGRAAVLAQDSPKQMEDQPVQTMDPPTQLLLEALDHLQNVVKFIWKYWRTTSSNNALLGMVYATLGWLHLMYSRIVDPKFIDDTHGRLGRFCLVAAMSTYGPKPTKWGVHATKVLSTLSNLFGTACPFDFQPQRFVLPASVRYLCDVIQFADLTLQHDLRTTAQTILLFVLQHGPTKNDKESRDVLLSFVRCYYSKADVRITANDQTPGSAGYSLFCFVHEKEV
jgi:hypothetical protein